VYDADTGERRVVLHSDRGLGEAAWSADDRTIDVKRDEADGTTSVLGIPLSGGPAFVALRLDDPRRTSHRSDFSSEGESFFFTLDIHERDIWRARTGR
jgi:hypothetical protein